MMDYAYLFSGMGVTILYLITKLISVVRQRNILFNTIDLIGRGELKVSFNKELDMVEIKEVKHV